MKFKYGTRRRAIEYEKTIAEYWKKNKTFEKSIEQRDPANSYVFYDGPPFITGAPHHGTLLSSIVKDAVPRYWTMKGKYVERRWGWDCHGLPAENFVEKQLGIEDRRQIGATEPIEKDGKTLSPISLEEYITKARESMVANSETWEQVIDRIGRWVDFRGAYRTMDKDFMESVWWAFKQLYDAGKIYEGEKVLMYDTKFATPVSKNEVTMDNDAYQTVTDPSVFVLFKLNHTGAGLFKYDPTAEPAKNEDNRFHIDHKYYVMAWTTTPWTLPANMALAVNRDIHYALVEIAGKLVFVSQKFAEKMFNKGEILRKNIPGHEFVGKQYVPILTEENAPADSENAHKIYAADFVEDEGGTGVVHVAPAYGPDDFELAQENNIPVLHTIDDDGYYLPEFAAKLEQIGVRPTDENGIEVWAANKFIAKCLEEKGIVWKIDYIQHEYPFNPRSKQRIMYRAIPSWFFDVQGQKPLMLEQNENINWFPAHIKHGRFAKNIEAAPDWNLSRDRFWATAMPVWKGDKGSVRVVGSYDELEKLSGVKLDDYHRPWVDGVEFDLPLNSGESTENTGIKAVIFDCFKVLVEGGTLAVLRQFDPDKKHEKEFKKLIEQHDLGKSIEWLCDEMSKINGIPASEMIEAVEKQIKIKKNTELLNYIQKNLAGKYKIGILSNVGPRQLVDNLVELDWGINFDDKVLSYEVGMTKPDKRIFELAAERLGVKPNECIFVDDRDNNIVAAEKVGMKGVLFDNTTNGIAEIKKLLSAQKPADTEHFTRIDKVFDGWFESGSMPFAQMHYPFENKEKFEANYPADFISEYIAQVRAWFYYVHVVNTALFGDNAFKNCIVTGTIAGEDGRKMSKSLGNYTDPNELMDKFSADSLRFLLLSCPLLSGEDFALKDKDVGDVARKLSMIWNMYDFFTMYAEVDGWEFDGDKLPVLSPNDVANPLDKWIISRVHQLVEHVTRHMDGYNLPEACSEVLPFLDDASNWYVRRSRRRFWKSEDDADKNQAYQTLHYVLVKIAQILAPFTPFLAEELYQKLTGGESVHLLDWPEAGNIDEKVLADMKRAREIIEQGLALRMEHDEFGQIKVRQPLSKLEYNEDKLDEFYEQIIAEEVNVKEVTQEPFFTGFMEGKGVQVYLDKTITPELKREGQAREIIRVIQKARKDAELNVDDRIILNLKTGDEDLQKAIDEWRETIAAETLAAQFAPNDGHKTAAKIDNIGLEVQLKKEE